MADAARAHGALTQPWDHDAEHFAGLVDGPDPVQLDAGNVARYHRLYDRFDAIWHAGANRRTPRVIPSPGRGGAREHIVAIGRRPADHVPLLGTYTELAWSAVAGPTAVLLARRISRLARTWPGGVDVDIDELAASVGAPPAGSGPPWTVS